MKLRRRKHDVPSLQMTAMPDLIFTILFFFMIVTHIRESRPQMRFEEPKGTNLQKVKKNASVVDVFVGKNSVTGQYEVQVNNSVVSFAQLPFVLRGEREKSFDEEQLCASLQADKETPMYIINRVKMALREAQILKINYGGVDSQKERALKEQKKE